MRAPVLFIGFNRPEKLRSVVEAVLKSNPSRLYFFADGPREGFAKDAEKCSQVREYIRSVDFKEKRVFFPERNLGCKYGPPTAVSWFFSKEEQGIILEDDIIPSDDFFPYCDHYLQLLEDNDDIGMICGFNPFGARLSRKDTLTKIPQIWGWASWRRAWKCYRNPLDWEEVHGARDKISAWLGSETHSRFWMEKFQEVTRRNLQTWDYQLVYAFLHNRMYSVLPEVNYIRNIGFDAEATHTTTAPSTLFLDRESRGGYAPAREFLTYSHSVDLRIGRDHFGIASRHAHTVDKIKVTLGHLFRYLRSPFALLGISTGASTRMRKLWRSCKPKT